MKSTDNKEDIKKLFFKGIRKKDANIIKIAKFVENKSWLIDEVDVNGNTALHYAALSGDMDKMNYFLGERVNIISPDESGIKTIVTIKMLDAIHPIDSRSLNSFGHNALHYFNNVEVGDSDFEYKKKKLKKLKDVGTIAVAETGVRYSEVDGSYFPNIVSSGSSATAVSVRKISDDNKLPSIKR